MNRSLLSLLALSTAAFAAPDDILRFTNGDQLHGHYQGIGEGNAILWSRDDLNAPLTLKSENVRHVILRGAAPQTDPSSYAYITLQNGDQIPGEVLSFDDKTTRIRSHAVGEITLPSESIAAINPNPFGGKLQYAGPFSPDGWEILKYEDKNSSGGVRVQVKRAGDVAPEPEKKDKPEEAKEEKKEPPAWQHAGSAWYHLKGMQPLARKNCLGESSLLRFRMAWRERLNANIALHADFMPPPEPKEGEEKEGVKAGVNPRQPMVFFNGMPQNQAGTFGNALVLNIYQTYFSLTRCGYDENGQAISQRMVHTQSSVQLPDSGEATIEVRSDRKKGLLMLFINGQYAAQWEDIDRLKNAEEAKEEGAATAPPLGNGFAIQCTNSSAPMRLSDLVISEWNGIKDSAYSMSHEKRDIVLLSNGTDRYSGEITAIKDNKAFFKNAYSELEIPLTKISEIVFAKNEKSETKEPAEGTVTARFYPSGKISGLPLVSEKNALKLTHPTAAQLTVDLTTAISLEFSDENPFLETMDNNQEKNLAPEK
jgi:hypothetical protein